MKICRISMLSLLLLSGCTPEVVKWSPAESPKENKVDRTVFTHVMRYPAHESAMSSLEKAKFIEFLKNNIPSPYAVRVTIEEYDGHSDKRLMDVERELLRYGVPLDRLHRNYDHVDDRYGEYHQYKYENCKKKNRESDRKAHSRESGSVIVIVVERFVVITPSCANFLEQIGNASQAYNSSNFGCSTEANLGLMIANPQDLLRGRDRDSYDGTVLAAGVKRYENDKVKPIVHITTTTIQNPTGQGGTGGGAGTSGSGY